MIMNMITTLIMMVINDEYDDNINDNINNGSLVFRINNISLQCYIAQPLAKANITVYKFVFVNATLFGTIFISVDPSVTKNTLKQTPVQHVADILLGQFHKLKSLSIECVGEFVCVDI